MRRKSAGGARQHDVIIEGLGARGDGFARSPTGTLLFVPQALPGERVLIKEVSPKGDGIRCETIEMLEASKDRIEPSCPHFGLCGGCQLQQLEFASYQQWKREKVESAVERAGFNRSLVQPMLTSEPRSRRRVRLAMENGVLGFRGLSTHRLSSIEQCSVVSLTILSAIEPLKNALGPLVKKAELTISQAENGLDLLIHHKGPMPDSVQSHVESLASIPNVVRLSWQEPQHDAELVFQREQPFVEMAGTKIPLPPGAFLQATVQGQSQLQSLVIEALETAKNVADLFSGLGTFAAPLSKKSNVTAVDNVSSSLEALKAAVSKVTTQKRDLFAYPLSAVELNKFDGIVFDPPRAGAKAQVEMIANSKVSNVVAVSCNPSSFSRDAKILKSGGYDLKSVTPVDQFLWSFHVELFAHFTRQT